MSDLRYPDSIVIHTFQWYSTLICMLPDWMIVWDTKLHWCQTVHNLICQSVCYIYIAGQYLHQFVWRHQVVADFVALFTSVFKYNQLCMPVYKYEMCMLLWFESVIMKLFYVGHYLNSLNQTFVDFNTIVTLVDGLDGTVY